MTTGKEKDKTVIQGQKCRARHKNYINWRARRRVPDIVLKGGDALLQPADLCISFFHRLDQIALRLLRLLQQLVGCR